MIRSMLTEELKDYLFALVDSGHHAECSCHDCETLALICAVLKARIFESRTHEVGIKQRDESTVNYRTPKGGGF